MSIRIIPGTEIVNDGASIRIITNGDVLLVNKLHIKTIDTIRDDVVRLNIGEGALRNVYIKFSSLINPNGMANATDLRDALNLMLQSSVNGGATEAKQDTELEVLGQILIALNNLKNTMSGGVGCRQPIRIDESYPNMIYNGFAVTGSSPSNPVWAIQRVTKDKDIIIYEWADGNELYDNVWDDRNNLLYTTIGGPRRDSEISE